MSLGHKSGDVGAPYQGFESPMTLEEKVEEALTDHVTYTFTYTYTLACPSPGKYMVLSNLSANPITINAPDTTLSLLPTGVHVIS